MKLKSNYIKYFDKKIDVQVTPLFIPYEGGNIEVLYRFNEYKKFSNGFITKNEKNKIKLISIPSRHDVESKYYDNFLSDEFYDSELDKIIKWDNVVQKGFEKPNIKITSKNIYLASESIPLAFTTSDGSLPEVIWEHKMIKKTSKASYSAVIENNSLVFNKEFNGIVQVTAHAEGYVSDSKLISFKFLKTAEFVYDIKDVKQSIYEADYNTKSFELSFIGNVGIIFSDSKVISNDEQEVTVKIYIPEDNMTSSSRIISSSYKWNGIDINYKIKQHGAKECNGEVDYEIISVSPQGYESDYIAADETSIVVKYMTKTIEKCFDGSIRETLQPLEEVVEFPINETSSSIIRTGKIKWQNLSTEWKCIQDANPDSILSNSISKIVDIEKNIIVDYKAQEVEIKFTGNTINIYESRRREEKNVQQSIIIPITENTSNEAKELQGNFAWNNVIGKWYITQNANPQKIISVQYDIDVVFPKSESDTISWSAETIELVYDVVERYKMLDGTINEKRDTIRETKTIEQNREIEPIILNGYITYGNSTNSWTCTQLPNEEIILSYVEFIISDISDSFTVPSTATTAEVAYNAVTRMFFKDGHYKDDISPKKLKLSFIENTSIEKKTINGVIKWNGKEKKCTIYQRGKKISV